MLKFFLSSADTALTGAVHFSSLDPGRHEFVTIRVMFGLWKRQSPIPDVILYTKQDCPLCEEAKAYLDELKATLQFNITVIDIQQDPKLIERYGTRVPLIIVNGREVVGYPHEKRWVKMAIKAGPRIDMR